MRSHTSSGNKIRRFWMLYLLRAQPEVPCKVEQPDVSWSGKEFWPWNILEWFGLFFFLGVNLKLEIWECWECSEIMYNLFQSDDMQMGECPLRQSLCCLAPTLQQQNTSKVSKSAPIFLPELCWYLGAKHLQQGWTISQVVYLEHYRCGRSFCLSWFTWRVLVPSPKKCIQYPSYGGPKIYRSHTEPEISRFKNLAPCLQSRSPDWRARSQHLRSHDGATLLCMGLKSLNPESIWQSFNNPKISWNGHFAPKWRCQRLVRMSKRMSIPFLEEKQYRERKRTSVFQQKLVSLSNQGNLTVVPPFPLGAPNPLPCTGCRILVPWCQPPDLHLGRSWSIWSSSHPGCGKDGKDMESEPC